MCKHPFAALMSKRAEWPNKARRRAPALAVTKQNVKGARSLLQLESG